MTVEVLKFGGSAFSPQVLGPFAQRVAQSKAQGVSVVIVHGGGKEITSLLERLGHESRFVDGLRVTDDVTLEAAEMVLSGRVNKAIVRGLQQAGVAAVGISGTDGGLLQATRLGSQRVMANGSVQQVDYGHVGEVHHVEPRLLHALLSGGFVPVISPLAMTEEGQLLNVNADTAAAAIAGCLRADAFRLLTDVVGVLVPGQNGARELAPELSASMVDKHKRSGVITGGMIPKVDACLAAVKQGASAARIQRLEDFVQGASGGTLIRGV